MLLIAIFFSVSVTHTLTRDAPPVDGVQPERHLRGFGGDAFDHLRFVQADSPPLDARQRSRPTDVPLRVSQSPSFVRSDTEHACFDIVLVIWLSFVSKVGSSFQRHAKQKPLSIKREGEIALCSKDFRLIDIRVEVRLI